MAKTRDTSGDGQGIEALMKVLPPPKAPVNTPNRDRPPQVEQELGSKLPDDYWQFGCVYGSGSFQQKVIWITNPTADNFTEKVQFNLDVLRVWRDNPLGEPPYPVFPDYPGLLPFGSDVTNATYSWLTDGTSDPSKWPVVIYGDGETAEEWKLTFTQFFVRYLTNKLKSKVIRSRTSPEDLVFVPNPG